MAPATGTNTVGSLRPIFDWTDVSGATGYTLQVSTASTFPSSVLYINTTGATASTFTPTADLPAGVHLWWRARANVAAGGNGPSIWSTPVFDFYTPKPPSAPTLVTTATPLSQ